MPKVSINAELSYVAVTLFKRFTLKDVNALDEFVREKKRKENGAVILTEYSNLQAYYKIFLCPKAQHRKPTIFHESCPSLPAFKIHDRPRPFQYTRPLYCEFNQFIWKRKCKYMSLIN